MKYKYKDIFFEKIKIIIKIRKHIKLFLIIFSLKSNKILKKKIDRSKYPGKTNQFYLTKNSRCKKNQVFCHYIEFYQCLFQVDQGFAGKRFQRILYIY